MYCPADRYVWDFWFAPRRDGEPYHLFHLQAPRMLADPDDRHWVATIGHAVSDDLVTWTPLPGALDPGPRGAWDERAVWTGSVVDTGNRWRMFYTGIAADRTQRIGVAESADLIAWRRVGDDPLLEPADPLYVISSNAVRGSADWRDPCVVRDPDQDRWLMFFTAAAPGWPRDACGVIGLAESRDLSTWSLLPPVSEPGIFGQLEVPQPFNIGERWYLTFCTDEQAPAAKSTPGGPHWIGTHYLVAERLIGPYRLTSRMPLLGDSQGSYYAGRLVELPNGAPGFMAFRRLEERGGFHGAISNPTPIEIAPDGSLRVDPAMLWPG